MKRLLLLAPLALILAACGGTLQGKVTAKMAPAGSSEQCTMLMAVPLVEDCETVADDQYKIVIENTNPKSAMRHDWSTSYMYVCLAPSRWRAVKLGQWFIVREHPRGDDDINCDG